MNMKLQTVMVLYSILMLGCSAPYEENSHSQPKSGQKALTVEEIAQAKASCLKTLHKVTSRDDLIAQMFETALEDDCLYHFTSAELEKIWGIPVFDYVQPADGTDFSKPLNKDIESPIGLYVEKTTAPAGATFRIEMTMTELNQHFSIFPKGHFTSVLPNPKSFALNEAALRHPPAYLPPYQSPPQAKIKAGRTYYWVKENRAVAVTSFLGEVTYLWFTNSRRYSDISDDSLAQADHSE